MNKSKNKEGGAAELLPQEFRATASLISSVPDDCLSFNTANESTFHLWTRGLNIVSPQSETVTQETIWMRLFFKSALRVVCCRNILFAL